MALVVRRAAAGDAPAAGRLVVEAYRGLPGYVDEPEYEVVLADVAARLPPAAEVLVAEDDGLGLVGCITYVPGPWSPLAELLHDGEAGIRMLGVAPAAQGRGAGRALVAACIERARGGGRRAVSLHSTSYMTAAHGLYRSFGFARTPARDWSPFAGLDLWCFTLLLPSAASAPEADGVCGAP